MPRPLFRDLWEGLRAQPGRAGLAFLAIAIGMVALTVLVTVLGGLDDRARAMVRDLGVNVFALLGPEEPSRTGRQLGREHVAVLKAGLADCRLAPTLHYPAPAREAAPLHVVATVPALLPMRAWRLTAGRFLDDRDIEQAERHMVVSSTLSRTRNWSPGSVVMMGDTPFRVVGVLQLGADALDAGPSNRALLLTDQTVFIPLTVRPSWLERTAHPPVGRVDALFVQAAGGRDLDQALAVAHRLLAQPDLETAGLTWITPDLLLRNVRRLQTTIKLTVGSIAFLCMVLGGTTLMSLMVANVRDRVSEIGLRRALGATPGDIASLFAMEATLITAVAALAGSCVTHALLFVGRHALPVPLRFGATSMLLPIALALLLGALFSAWPAHAAATISPADALRND